MTERIDAKKLEEIAFIADRHNRAVSDEDGDRHLSDPNLAMEAVTAILDNWRSNGALRMFLEFPAAAE